MTLAVLDADVYGKISPRILFPMPHTYSAREGSGLVVIADRSPGSSPPRADPEHAAGGILQGEQTLFHEAGHLFAGALKIESGNAFVNELIAGVFMVGYISAQRPDLNWILEDRRSRQSTAPRYTSLADLDYLYSGVGQQNYFWFQARLVALADFLAGGRGFPAVIAKLQTEFPADRKSQETLQEITTHLDRVRPGFLRMAGALAGPSTITRITPSACPEPSEKRGARSPLVVHNDTTEPLVTIGPAGEATRIPARAWRTYSVAVGAAVKLSDGACLVARDEPTLAVITAP
jgi:hypothetical protein